MKKILLVSVGKCFPKGALDFIAYLHEQEPVLVTGMLFPHISYAKIIGAAYAPGADVLIETQAEEEEAIHQSIADFEDYCRKNDIDYRVRMQKDLFSINDVVIDTRFADLLVLSGTTFDANPLDDELSASSQQILHQSECPVIVIPEKFTSIDKIVLTYDGEKESMYALKQFSYLFPGWRNLEVCLVYVNAHDNADIPYFDYLKEYAARHFSNLTFSKLTFEESRYFITWAQNEKNALVVAGAFGRSGLSMVFHSSFLKDLIDDHSMGLFITHPI